jgi:hypothetical protein
MEGTSGADVLDKQHNVIRMVSMTCSEGILLRLGLQRDDDILLTRVSTDTRLMAIAELAG